MWINVKILANFTRFSGLQNEQSVFIFTCIQTRSLMWIFKFKSGRICQHYLSRKTRMPYHPLELKKTFSVGGTFEKSFNWPLISNIFAAHKPENGMKCLYKVKLKNGVLYFSAILTHICKFWAFFSSRVVDICKILQKWNGYSSYIRHIISHLINGDENIYANL